MNKELAKETLKMRKNDVVKKPENDQYAFNKKFPANVFNAVAGFYDKKRSKKRKNYRQCEVFVKNKAKTSLFE
ncbi:MAG: hypothetical protein JW715_14675 [Sedimentisphaerales bacterium]|nr:hypothetical protein [Sedimentisphaerales bacterium]